MFHLRKQSGICLDNRTSELLHDGTFVYLVVQSSISSVKHPLELMSDWLAGLPDKQMPDGTHN